MAQTSTPGEKRPSSTVPSRSAQKRAKKEEPKKVVVDLTADDEPSETADNNNDYEKEYKVTLI